MTGPSRATLSILALNICGVKSKLESQCIKDLFSTFDLIFLSEIKCTYPFAIPGFDCTRSSVIAGEETRGGVAVLIRASLRSYVYQMETHKDLISFKMKHAPALTFMAAYVAPRDSPYFSATTYATINEICKRDHGEIVLMGDFNARMDALQTNFGEEQKQIHYEPNIDPSTNTNGHDLISLMKKNKLKPLNHMTYREKRFKGGYTFKKRSNWISQLDWAIVSSSILDTIQDMEVMSEPRVPSDHAPIRLMITETKVPDEDLLHRAEDLGTSSWQNHNSRTPGIPFRRINERLFKEALPDPANLLDQDTDLSTSLKIITGAIYAAASSSKHPNPDDPGNETENGRGLNVNERWQHLLNQTDEKKLWNSIAWNGTFDMFSNNTQQPNDESFCAHYRTLLRAENTTAEYTPSQYKYIPLLDDPIAVTEIDRCIRKLKAEKAYGVDGIAPGLLKHLPDEWITMITVLFNAVFDGEYPDSWSQARVVNIYKKGDRLQPQNYRGISVMNAMAKLYDMILAERFVLWYKPHEEQAGAQQGRGCSEQILAVRLLIDVSRKTKKPLYLCFIDFEKAYDKVDRHYLMKRLDNKGCGTKFLQALQKSYRNTEGQIGECCFQATQGVRQGACTSCPLFTFLVDVLIEKMHNFGQDDWLGNIHLLMLMDDTVIMGTSREALQLKLNMADLCLKEMGMKVNASKTQFLTISSNDKNPFQLGDAVIQYTDKYKYLGTWITNKPMAEQIKAHIIAKKPQSLKFSSFLHKNIDAPYMVKRKVWQSALLASIFYSAESWLCNDLRSAESLYYSTLKQMLGVRATTCNDLCLVEAGEPSPVQFIRQLQKRFLDRLKNRPSFNGSYLETILQLVETHSAPSANMVRTILEHPIEQTENAVHLQIREATTTRRTSYLAMNRELTLHEAYRQQIREQHRIALTRLRLSSHHLSYERGRWSRIPQESRMCECGEVSSDHHVLLRCAITENARQSCAQLDYSTLHSLMNSEPSELAEYCHQIFQVMQG